MYEVKLYAMYSDCTFRYKDSEADEMMTAIKNLVDHIRVDCDNERYKEVTISKLCDDEEVIEMMNVPVEEEEHVPMFGEDWVKDNGDES